MGLILNLYVLTLYSVWQVVAKKFPGPWQQQLLNSRKTKFVQMLASFQKHNLTSSRWRVKIPPPKFQTDILPNKDTFLLNILFNRWHFWCWQYGRKTVVGLFLLSRNKIVITLSLCRSNQPTNERKDLLHTVFFLSFFQIRVQVLKCNGKLKLAIEKCCQLIYACLL